MSSGAVFADREVARLYRHRAPYPDELPTILNGLTVAPRRILDVGAGTGALARPMVAVPARVEAVDPPAARNRERRPRPGALLSRRSARAPRS